MTQCIILLSDTLRLQKPTEKCIRQTNESRRHNKHQAMKLEGNVLVCTRTLTRRLAVSLVYYTEVTETYGLFCMIPNYQLTANPWAMTLKEITAILLMR